MLSSIGGGRPSSGGSSDLTAVNSAISQLQSEVSTMSGQVSSISTNLTTVTSNLNAVSSDLSSANSNVTALQSQVDQRQIESGAGYYILFEEFDTATPAGQWGWSAASSGTGATSNSTTYVVNGTDRAIGVATFTTGTTTTGRTSLSLGSTAYLFGFCNINFEARVRVSELNDVSNQYVMYCGILDNTTAGDVVDGVYFRYDATTGFFKICASNNNVRTVTETTVAPGANQWVKLAFNVTAAGVCTFFINGNLVGTISTNVPTGSGRSCAPGMKIEKTLGTLSRTMECDYVKLKSTWANPR